VQPLLLRENPEPPAPGSNERVCFIPDAQEKSSRQAPGLFVERSRPNPATVFEPEEGWCRMCCASCHVRPPITDRLSSICLFYRSSQPTQALLVRADKLFPCLEYVITRAICCTAGFDRARVTNADYLLFVRRTVSGWNQIPLGRSIRHVVRGPSGRVQARTEPRDLRLEQGNQI